MEPSLGQLEVFMPFRMDGQIERGCLIVDSKNAEIPSPVAPHGGAAQVPTTNARIYAGHFDMLNWCARVLF